MDRGSTLVEGAACAKCPELTSSWLVKHVKVLRVIAGKQRLVHFFNIRAVVGAAWGGGGHMDVVTLSNHVLFRLVPPESSRDDELSSEV